jgi:hypothetical protein
MEGTLHRPGRLARALGTTLAEVFAEVEASEAS